MADFYLIKQIPREHILYGYKYNPTTKTDIGDEENPFKVEYEYRNENSPL